MNGFVLFASTAFKKLCDASQSVVRFVLPTEALIPLGCELAFGQGRSCCCWLDTEISLSYLRERAVLPTMENIGLLNETTSDTPVFSEPLCAWTITLTQVYGEFSCLHRGCGS
jgi:hypothetical protein